MIKKFQLSSIRREEKISKAGKAYNVLLVRLNGKEREEQIFDRSYLTKDWQTGNQVDLAVKQKQSTDDYGNPRTFTSFEIPSQLDYLEERMDQVEKKLAELEFMNPNVGMAKSMPAIQSSIPQQPKAQQVEEIEVSIDNLPF